MNLIFCIMGLVGGLLCCAGDLLFDLKGKGNKKLGTSKNIDSNWSKMSEWRFGVSIICAMFGVIFVGFGFYAMADMIRENNTILSNIILITGFIGCIGGLFVHALLCVQTVIYKRITDYCWMAGVIPQYRKSGVLTAMMEYLKNWSKEQGYKNLRIKTRNTRREMLSFLVKNNFNFYEIEAQENIRDNRICLEIHL